MNTQTPNRIYVACLAAYNAGNLHGTWIDIEPGCERDDIQTEISEMLAESPIAGAEEWAIHDAVGFDRLVSEYESLETICELAALFDSYPRGAVLHAWNVTSDVGQIASYLDDHYAGHWDTVSDFAEDDAENAGLLGGVPDFIRYCIDWEAVARNLEVQTIRDEDGGLHVFWP